MLLRKRPLTVILGSLLGLPLHAQTTQPDNQVASTSPTDLGTSKATDKKNSAAVNAKNMATITVTSTHRSQDLQKVPINITAVSGTDIAQLRLNNINDLAKWVPGITVIDQGPRVESAIVMRGISVNSINSSGDNQTVGTYLGEAPMWTPFKLIDMERVEVLEGPQGTLYGAGTLAGAVRYIPNRPDLETFSGSVHAKSYALSHSAGIGGQSDVTLNIPIVQDRVALREAIGYYHDPGFIDYPGLVDNPGTSLPQPSADERAGNVHTKHDVNGENTLSARTSLLAKVSDNVDLLLTWLHQDTRAGGFQTEQVQSAGTGRYESGEKVPDPFQKKSDLLNMELDADLGFAKLVSSTTIGRTNSHREGDNTPFLLDGEYGYEDFPNFVSNNWTNEKRHQQTQELRLTSNTDGKFNWSVGGYYNKYNDHSHYEEHVPGYSQWANANGVDGILERADNLEYWSRKSTDFKEKALFAEVGYHFTDAWQLTVGARYYRYDETLHNAYDLPLENSSLTLTPNYRSGSTKASGTRFKYNTSYQINDNIMAYATVSQGYQIGGINGATPCDTNLSASSQHACALPNELTYKPDLTLNKELGVRTTWLDHRLVVNADVYRIDWRDIQIRKTTQYGGIGITGNGGTAVSKGGEFSWRYYTPYGLSIMGNYTYTDAYLTEGVAHLLQDRDGAVDVMSGDRLPGTPKHKVSLGIDYTRDIFSDYSLDINYNVTSQSSVLTKVGGRAGGETLGGYTISNASIGISKDKWQVSLYGQNLFNKYAYTAVSEDTTYITKVNGFDTRYYSRTITRPREVGIDFRYDF